MAGRVALAASGSPNAISAELFALGYCRKHRIDELLVIHVVDTGLAHYGEVDQLASGNCKDDFVSYIHESAQATSQNLQLRLKERAREFGVSIEWLHAAGEVVEMVKRAVLDHSISTLIAGAGKTPQNFFAPKKKTAIQLLSTVEDCKIFTVAPE